MKPGSRVRCNVCGQFFLTAADALTHWRDMHRAFQRKPLYLAIWGLYNNRR
jgi:hypothetical protein